MNLPVKQPTMSRTRTLTWLVVIFLAAWGFLVFRIGNAWVGHQDANGAWISSAIHNYERYGFANLGGMIVLNHSPITAGNYDYYASHPPLAVWLPTLPVLLVGYDEAIVRFVFAACTMLAVAALYALVRRLFGRARGMWSAAFFAFTPMIAYFGRMPDHEAPALLILLLFAWVLVLWLQNPTRLRWLALAALMLAQSWTAWGGLISTFAVCTAGLWAAKRAQRRDLFVLLVIGAVGVLLVVAFYQAQWSETINTFVEKFLWRSSSQSFQEGSEPFTLIDYVLRLLVRCITLFTPMICLLALLGFLPVVRSQTRLRRAIPLALLLGGLGFMLLFRNASYIHDYYLIYVTPAVAIFATVGLWEGWDWRRGQRWLRPALLGVILILPLGLVHYVGLLHQGDTEMNVLLVAEAVQRHADGDDLVMSNLATFGPAIEFYAERDILWNAAPALAVATSLERRGVYYFHCGAAEALPTGSFTLIESAVVPGCSLLRLS